MQRSIVLSYTVQKIVTVDINDFELTVDEIDDYIDNLFQSHAPDDFEITRSDYEYFGDSEEPRPKGCQPLPTDDCWVDIAGEQWATNGWCMVTPSCPSLNDGNIWQAWHKSSDVSDSLRDVFERNFQSDRPHQGYFDKRFAPIKEIGCKVYGESPIDLGWCVKDGNLIAIIMPVNVSGNDSPDRLFMFN